MTDPQQEAPATPEEIADRGVLHEQLATAPVLKGEPAAVIGTIVAVLVAVQELALPIPAWANTVIAVMLIIAGALGIRQQVTPVHG
jgi:uncharacterized protein YacL